MPLINAWYLVDDLANGIYSCSLRELVDHPEFLSIVINDLIGWRGVKCLFNSMLWTLGCCIRGFIKLFYRKVRNIIFNRK